LHRHIHRTYTRDIFTHGWVQILAAEQTSHSGEWYQGTPSKSSRPIPSSP
jgi:glucose-1-phosphate adenylyltransferase